MKYILAPQADQDLDDLFQYSLKKWGYEQTITYLEKIEDAFRMIAMNPDIITHRKVDRLTPDLRRYAVGRHYIYYFLHEDRVEIVRVIHDQRNQSVQFR